jgi:hypothetical protein
VWRLGLLLATVVPACDCNGGGGAGAIDAAISMDAQVDAASGSVRVTVLKRDRTGDVDPTARVVFLDPNGTVLADKPVDPNGVAQTEMPDGGELLVIRVQEEPGQRRADITSVRGVQPGDDLIAGRLRWPGLIAGTQTSMNATFSSIGPYEYSEYRFHTACGTVPGVDDIASVSLPLFPSCHDATFGLLAVAPTYDNAVPRFSWAYVPDVTYVENGQIQLPTWTAMQDFTVTLSGLPMNMYMGALLHWSIIDDMPLAQTMPSEFPTTVSPGVEQATCEYAAGVGAGSYVKVFVQDFEHGTSQVVHERVLHSSPDGLAFQYGSSQLPQIITLPDSTGTGARWTEIGTNQSDMRVVYWQGTWADGPTAVDVRWTIIDDGATAGSVDITALPPTYSKVDARLATDVVYDFPGGQPSVYYVDYTHITSFAEARRWGDNLVDSILKTGVFTGMEYERRLSTHPTAIYPPPNG